jgi:hypothetical protein
MQSSTSSGFSSMASLDTESVNSNSKYEDEIAKLKLENARKCKEIEDLKNSSFKTELMNLKHVHELNEVCKKNATLQLELDTEKQSKEIMEREIEDLKRLNTELLEELGRVETEQGMRVNDEKNATWFQNIFPPKRKMAESEKPNVLKSDKVCLTECSASTERPTDKLETLTSNHENVDGVSLGSPGNETYSDHLQSENISPGQDEDSSNKASRAPSFVPDNEPATEETHTASPPLLEKDNSFRDQEQHDAEMNISDNELDHLSRCYKKILKIIQQNLLSQDVLKLKEWACQKLSTDGFEDVADVLACLEQQGIIGASNLSELRSFFESITKFDFVHVIDLFLQGDTTVLQKYNLRE